jgi:predicted nucleic-acid-binding protein
MKGLDTNVLVRLLVRDDARQFAAARRAVERAADNGELFVVSLLTMLEAEWVLRSRYGFDKTVVITVFRALLESRDLMIEEEATLEQGLHHYEHHAVDFAECLMLARYQRMHCDTMLTFDRRAARLPGCELVAAK